MEQILPHLDSVFSIDCVLFGFDGKELKILLIERNEEPFKDWWALPGNIVGVDESLDQSAARILYELTGLRGIYMEQYYAFGDPGRHPQGRVITLAYYALIRLGGDKDLRPISTYAKQANWLPITALPKLAFDHQKIYDKGLEKIKRRIKHQPIAFELLPEKFTIPQLQKLYEAIFGTELDKRNFSRKLLSTNLLVKLDEKQKGYSKKGAYFYKIDEEKYKKHFNNFLNFLPGTTP